MNFFPTPRLNAIYTLQCRTVDLPLPWTRNPNMTESVLTEFVSR